MGEDERWGWKFAPIFTLATLRSGEHFATKHEPLPFPSRSFDFSAPRERGAQDRQGRGGKIGLRRVSDHTAPLAIDSLFHQAYDAKDQKSLSGIKT